MNICMRTEKHKINKKTQIYKMIECTFNSTSPQNKTIEYNSFLYFQV